MIKNISHSVLPLLFAAALSLAGCSAFEDMAILQEKPVKEASEGFMDTEENIESVLFSSYYQLKRYNCFSRYYPIIVEAMSDYCNGQGSYASASDYEGLDPTLTARTNDVWACMYRAVRFANIVILNAPGAEHASAEVVDNLVAEAKFIRAFTYMHLAQNWGAVPLVTEENMHQSGDINYPRTPVETVYALCESDLLYAAEHLPDKAKMMGRPQKMTANTVLTEVYLLEGKWQDAADAAKKVIDSKQYSLVEVSAPDDFYKLFSPDLASSPEEIFYLKYSDSFDKSYGSCFAAMYHRGGQYFNGSNYYGIYTTYDNNRIADWDDNDLRKAFNTYEIDSDGEVWVMNKKFTATKANGDAAGNDYPMYRYADLLLYYAEAACRAAGAPTAEALEALNMVHRRAYGKPSTTPDASVDYKLSDAPTADEFITLVLKERLYETCYEGKRYNDLKRVGKLAEYVLDAKGTVVKDGGYWFPIPNDEFLYNKGMDVAVDQNPGY